MTTTNFNMRLDSEIKEQLSVILADYGLTIPQAFKLFANQIIKTKEVPLTFNWASQPNYVPNAMTEQALHDALSERNTATRYQNNDAMLQAIMSADCE